MSYVKASWSAVLLSFGVVLAVGCAPAEEPADGVESTEAALEETTTITFDGAWNERAAAPLQKGKKVRVVYDAGRLTCERVSGLRPRDRG
jgi:hypothetical protein